MRMGELRRGVRAHLHASIPILVNALDAIHVDVMPDLLFQFPVVVPQRGIERGLVDEKGVDLVFLRFLQHAVLVDENRALAQVANQSPRLQHRRSRVGVFHLQRAIQLVDLADVVRIREKLRTAHTVDHALKTPDQQRQVHRRGHWREATGSRFVHVLQVAQHFQYFAEQDGGSNRVPLVHGAHEGLDVGFGRGGRQVAARVHRLHLCLHLLPRLPVPRHVHKVVVGIVVGVVVGVGSVVRAPTTHRVRVRRALLSRAPVEGSCIFIAVVVILVARWVLVLGRALHV
mmetsp:Transcript_22273/g.56260  ORF Transcript_22273/g.56260 Transcript_22273/m.56260 type:complete len:287 (+) Transcript_22273:1450-2310(+)